LSDPLPGHVRFLAVIAALAALNAALFVTGDRMAASRVRVEERNRDVVRALGLTDLSLWTEARFTRHPSQTDFFSPFQDLPGGMDHFPAAALMVPPAHLAAGGGRQRKETGTGGTGRP
jgi:hypothetical protein